MSTEDYNRILTNEGTNASAGVLKSGIILYTSSDLTNRIYGYGYVKYNDQINDMNSSTGTVSSYTIPQC